MTARIVVGSLGKPHGLKGEVVLLTGSDDLSQFVKGTVFLTQQGDELTVRTFRDHSGTPIISFQGITFRDQCEVLRGVQLTVAAGDRRDLPEDHYWTEDLVGMDVVDEFGKKLGVVKEAIFGSAQDRLAIDTGESVSEVPFVEAFFPAVDRQAGELTIAPIEGLL
jgi:16S rRNA processing protein RimM